MIIKIKPKLIPLLGVIMLVGLTLLLLPKIISKNNKDVLAGKPEVKGSSDENYDYEFEGGSFKLYLGEIAGNPAMLVKQGSRELEMTLFEGKVRQVDQVEQVEQVEQESQNIDGAITPSASGESINATPEENVSSTPSPLPLRVG